MYAAFPRSDYYGSSAPCGQHQRATRLPFVVDDVRGCLQGSHVHFLPLTRRGVPLYPCSFAAATPQAFAAASRPATYGPTREFTTAQPWLRAATQPISVRLELVVLS